MQPAASASSSSASIRVISAAVAARYTSSIAAARSAVWPTSGARLSAGGDASTSAMYSRIVGNRYHDASPSRFMGAGGSRPANGARLAPQLPVTTDVTPWLTFGVMSGPDSTARSSWVWASMNPGATTRPEASILLVASMCRSR